MQHIQKIFLCLEAFSVDYMLVRPGRRNRRVLVLSARGSEKSEDSLDTPAPRSRHARTLIELCAKTLSDG